MSHQDRREPLPVDYQYGTVSAQIRKARQDLEAAREKDICECGLPYYKHVYNDECKNRYGTFRRIR